jgi:hypothetical protein
MDWCVVVRGVGVLALSGLVVSEAAADVICMKKKGVLLLRAGTTCRKRETPVDLSAIGLVGPKGEKGDTGDPGEPGPFPTANLPSGVTLRGVYRVAGERDATANNLAQDAITFVFPLASEPVPHLIEAGDPAPAACPGSVAAPEAQAGHLCVYEQFASASVMSANKSIGDPVLNVSPGASRFGFSVSAQASSAGNFAMVGTWAVTAP